MPFEVTTSLRKMLDMKARKKVIQGATSSGKTYGIIPIIYDKCLATPRLKCTVVAETLPAVKEGCVDIFKNFMMDEGRWIDEQWNATELTYTSLNKSKIQFKSFDSVGKAKAAGKRDILFLNEGNHIPYPIADALIIRSQEVWIDFNADSEFWAHTEVLQQPNSEFLKLTYLDNEAIPSATFEDLMYKKSKAEQEERNGVKGYWWNWWQVYGLGEIGNLQGAVFNNYKIIDSTPLHAKLLGYGLDYGYRNDPTALVAIYYADNIYYLDELIYQTGLLNRAISQRMNELGVDRYTSIVADSAEMKSNDELLVEGWRIIDAKKGADSIVYGISRMQELELRITARSLNLINEFRKYTWATDRDGNAINKPIDAYNHCFTGDTLVTTIKGDIPIKDIKIGDLVLTSQGYRRVLKKFNNGIKQISKYSMQFDTFSVCLRSTKDHKVKTKEGWKEISKLKKNDVLYHVSNLTVKLLRLEEEESKSETVYDLMIDDCHEYYANGILVHNCIDAIRYYFQTNTANPNAPRFFV